MKIQVKANTGSLAEVIGGELYEGEVEYKLKYVKANVELDIAQRQNEEKYLEIYWKKPDLEQLEVDRYEIYDNSWYSSDPIKVIQDQNQTSFVDKNYVYGHKTYYFKTYFKDNKLEPKEDFYTVAYEPIKNDEIFSEVRNIESVYLRWNNPNTFPCKYILKSGSSSEKIDVGDKKEAVLPRAPFPAQYNNSYYLYILPKDAEIDEYMYRYHSIEIPYIDKRMENAPSWFITDVKNHLLYGYTIDNLYFYDPQTLETIKTVPFAGVLSGARSVILSTETGNIALFYNSGKINIFEDNTFNTIIASFDKDYYSVYSGFYFIGEDMFMIQKDNGFDVYNISGQNLLYTVPINGYNFAVSTSNKYFVYRSDYEIKIYELGETSFSLKYAYSGKYDNPQAFNPLNASHLIIRSMYENGQGYTKILDVETLKTITFDGNVNFIDAFTGNMIVRDVDFYNTYKSYIISFDYEKKYEINNSPYYYDLSLINNYLFYDGYYLDLSKALKK